MGVVVVVAVVLAIVSVRSLIVVPAGSAYVVERLGRYRATLSPGLHVLLPFLDRIAHKYSITLDNIPVSVKATLTWQITAAERAAYAAADVADFVGNLVRTTQRQWISERPWTDVRETTRELQQAVLRSTEAAAASAGVTIVA